MSRRRNRRPHPGTRSTSLVKANGLIPGAPGLDRAVGASGAVVVPLEQVLAILGQQGKLGALQQGESLPRPTEWTSLPFGPGQPLAPAPINELGPQGRPAPRRYDYPVSANLPGVELRHVPFALLREAADKVGLMRRAIEVRKNELAGLDWDFVVSDEAMEMAKLASDTDDDAKVARELRKESAEDIARLKKWWRVPDRDNGIAFESWLMMALEEHLVLDALAIYPHLTLGGDLFSLNVLDGSTIKPLLDERGNTPAPPFPAYQQILHGFPRGEFVADVSADPDDPAYALLEGAYQRDQLVYAVRNVRSFTPYGNSAVEQALVDVDLWMKRQAWMRSEYDDGVMPTGWLKTDSALTPQQLRDYAIILNDQLAGITQERHRLRPLPKGFEPQQMADQAERYKPDYDEFLVKLVLSHFGVLPSKLGFTPKSGLGGKGHQEGEQDSEERAGTRPTLLWMAGLITQLSRQFLGCPDGVEFRFLGLDAEDEKAADDLDDARVKGGRMTLNESRDRLGQSRYDFPEADMPMIVTQSGVIFLEGESEKSEPAMMPFGVAPAPAGPGGAAPGAPGAAGAPAGPPAGPAAPAAAKPAPQPAAKSGGPQDAAVKKADELAALRRWARKGNRSRTFTVEHLTLADVAAAGIDTSLVKAGGGASREAVARVGDAHPGGGAAPASGRFGFAWSAGQ